MRIRSFAFALLLTALPHAALRAQVDAQQVNQAIDRGVDWLLRIQRLDGSWSAYEREKYHSGPTALALLTLLKCGVPERHPAVLRALSFLEAYPPQQTYSLGCYMMALHAMKEPPKEALQRSLDLLLETQPGSQYIAYPEGQGDLSCQQYAALGYKVALERGLVVPLKTFERLAAVLLRYQKADGGFGYTGNDTPTGSMTAAGAACLMICKQGFEQLERGKSWGPKLDAATELAAQWIANNWQGPSNARPGHDPKEVDGWRFYFLYGLERFGAFAKREHFGKYPWYTIGAEWLLEAQEKNGRWPAPYDRQDEFDTCFALLFLRRASAPTTGSAPSKRFDDAFGNDDEKLALSVRGDVSNDGFLQFWIARFGNAVFTAHQIERDGKQGLALQRVTWILDDQEVATLEADPARLYRDGRFAHRIKIENNATHQVAVRVQLTGRDGTTQEIRSEPITARITTRFGIAEQQLCADVKQNLLREEMIEAISASSQIDDGWWRAQSAVDQHHSSGWRAKADDATPTLAISLNTPLSIQSLAFTPATPRPGDNLEEWSAPTKISIKINNSKPQVFALGTARNQRHRVQLDKPMRVRKIEITILERSPGPNGNREVGFQEIEMYGR